VKTTTLINHSHQYTRAESIHCKYSQDYSVYCQTHDEESVFIHADDVVGQLQFAISREAQSF